MSAPSTLACLDPWIGCQFYPRASMAFCCLSERNPGASRGIMADYNGAWAQSLRERFARGGRCQPPPTAPRCQYPLNRAHLRPETYRLRAYGAGPDKAFLAALRDRRREIEERRVVVQHPPLKLGLVTDLTCNLSCIFCAQRASVTKHGNSPQVRLPQWLLDEAEGLLDRVGSLHVSGGEVFASKPTVAFLRRLADQRSPVQVVLLTNGTRVDHDLIRVLNVERIDFSIDGATPGTYEKMRPGSDFYTVLSHLTRVVADRRRRNLCLPTVTFIFCRETVADVPLAIDMYERSLGLGIRFQNKNGLTGQHLNWERASEREVRSALCLTEACVGRTTNVLTRNTLSAVISGLRAQLRRMSSAPEGVSPQPSP